MRHFLFLFIGHADTDDKPKSEVDSAVDLISDVAKRTGLEPDCIEALMEFVTGREGGRGIDGGCGMLLALLPSRPLGVGGTLDTRTKVLRCLIPRTTVPPVVFIRALSRMRSQQHSLRQLLFKWMVLTFDLVERKESLRAMYDVIFQYLGYDELRGPACQLLCYMTTRNHGNHCNVCLFVDF